MIRGSARRAKGQKPQTVDLPIEAILPDLNQPRKTFTAETLTSLAQSFLKTGQISPIAVRPGPDKKYTIVVGERRWRAAKEAGLSHVECIIRQDIDDQRAIEMQIAENSQRDDIPPLEQARSFRNYLDRYKVSQSELSRRTGIPQRTISNRLALLSLPASLQARIEAGAIGPYEALKIAALSPEQQEAVAEAVSSRQVRGRALEKLTRGFSQGNNGLVQETGQPAKAAETNTSLSQRLENLEEAIYRLAVAYAFNEAAKERKQGVRKAPPCPECLRRGDSGFIWGIKRKMTPKERREWIESVEENEEFDEEDKEELLNEKSTYIIEARCRHCGYNEVMGYERE